MSGLSRHCSLLTTALVGALLPKEVPEGQTIRAWLDSWAGVGHVVDAMHAEGYNVRLLRSPFVWRAEFCRDESTRFRGGSGWRPTLRRGVLSSGRPWRRSGGSGRRAVAKTKPRRLEPPAAQQGGSTR
jgi:hypothetical protein